MNQRKDQSDKIPINQNQRKEETSEAEERIEDGEVDSPL